MEKSATEARANENAGRTEKKEENRSHSGSNHLEQTERRNEDKAPEATPKPEAALSRGSRRKNLLQGSMTNARNAVGRYTDIKIRILDRLCIAGELQRTPQMSKDVTVSEYDGDHDGAPVRSMLVLRAWMLWRATQYGWHDKHPARSAWLAREAEQLRNDIVACGPVDGHVLSTGNARADAEIMKFWPDALT